MKEERRKNLIVNRLQYRMVFHAFGLVLGVSLILILSLIFIFGPENVFAPGRNYTLPIIIFIIIAIVLYYLSYVTLLRLSNRIYGPLHRLASYLKKLSEGIETGEIKFRKGDVVNGIQEIYNELCHSLTKTLHYDYNELVNTFSQLEDILDRIHSKSISENELYNSLEKICERLADALDLTTDVIHQKDNNSD
ncbi:MAG: hypothetical protein ABIL69_05605 [candidate division WOR-3 bacterium]